MGGFKGLKRCAHCDYKHRLISQVRRHVKQAHGDRAVVCTVDGCAVRLPYNRLARHMREKHSSSIAANNKPDTVPKDICAQGVLPKAMSSRKLRKKGNKSNPTEAPSKVLPTTKSTSNNSGRTTFSDLQQFSCPTCDKPAKSRQALRKHINEVHDKIYKQYRREKSLLCDWPGCEKAFIAASKLADHRNTHTGERPYSCDHCRKDFSSKHEFSRHIRKYHQVSLREINSQIQQCVE